VPDDRFGGIGLTASIPIANSRIVAVSTPPVVPARSTLGATFAPGTQPTGSRPTLFRPFWCGTRPTHDYPECSLREMYSLCLDESYVAEVATVKNNCEEQVLDVDAAEHAPDLLRQYINIYTYICVCVCVCIHTHATHTRTHTQTHTHTYIYTYI